MAIPTYDQLMIPFLRELADGSALHIQELITRLADRCELSAEERDQLLPSGQQRVFNNRVGWARTYLKKAGLIVSPKRGVQVISDAGRALLAEGVEQLDQKGLMRYESFREFYSNNRKAQSKSRAEGIEEDDSAVATPEETLDEAYQQLRDKLAADMLDTLKACTPYFFEKVVLKLLQAMGYGGVRRACRR